MEQEKPSLLSQHRVEYIESDDHILRKLLGQWKAKLREVIRSPEATNAEKNRAMKKLINN